MPEQESRLHEMTVQYMHLTGRVEQMEVKVKALAKSSPIYTELKHFVSLTSDDISRCKNSKRWQLTQKQKRRSSCLKSGSFTWRPL